MQYVFVYGTLLNGEGNNRRFLQNAESRLVGETRVQGFSLRDMGSFPTVLPVPDINKEVVGEVWEVSNEVFQSLDYLEGYPSFYDRIQVGTSLGEAWIYVNNRAEKYPEIPSGSWRQHLGK